MKLIELVEKVSNLIGEELDCLDRIDNDCLSYKDWQKVETIIKSEHEDIKQ